MPAVNFERILSVNSEEYTCPAENLLKLDNKKSWKCKPGEKQAIVILQLKQETVIDGIDIGNENSAFVEVLVGKSSSLSNDFKVLLVASSLMTLKEAKDGTNINGVRFFKKSDLTKLTADERWDRVKIVCTQPFNKHVQYGLAFIVLHSSSRQDVDGESNSILGKFALKEEEKEQPVSVGSWFAKRKDPPPPIPLGAAAAIRDASSPAGIGKGKNKKPTPKRPKNIAPKNEDEDSPADDTDADSTYSPNKDSFSALTDDDILQDESDEDETRKRKKNNRKINLEVDVAKNAKNGQTLNGKTTKQKKYNDSGSTKTKTIKDRGTKPFERLLEGVTIVISGYQNPLRGELRSKACGMGAKYKADWDKTSTHLICAFVNTPKFNQVRGKGKIIKKDWIEECHNCRRRLPWRRFALDRNDNGTSSEEEIWEEGSIPTTSNISTVIASGVNRRSVSSGSDTEDEIERVRAKQARNNLTTPTQAKQKKDDLKKPGKVIQNKTNPFADDTDVDSESDSQTAKIPLPPLPAFFDNIVFYIASDIDDEGRRKLERYISAYKGCVVDEVDGMVEYVITKLLDTAAEVAEEFGIVAVSPDWVWECSDSEKLVPVAGFLL